MRNSFLTSLISEKMIKELIKEITFDKISLSQALTRAKLIAYEIKNDDLKNWLNKELNGYSTDDKLPEYRIIPCDIYAVIEGYGMRKMIPFDLSEIDKDLKGKLYRIDAIQSIATIEEGLLSSENEQYGYEDLPIPLVSMLRKMSNNQHITSIKRRVQFSQVSHILNLTKQKLIDTLLELNDVFPDLENNYQNTPENQQKTRTIINNHIYGDNSNSNIGVGDNLTQSITSNYAKEIERILSDIHEIGVSKEDIDEVRSIIEKETNKVNLGKRLMKWVGKMSNKAIEKGIELKMPVLIEKIQELM